MPPRKSSAVWRYYDEGRGVNDVKTGTCRLCDELKVFKLNQNCTSPLWNHLEKAHKADFDKIDKIDPLRNVVKAAYNCVSNDEKGPLWHPASKAETV